MIKYQQKAVEKIRAIGNNAIKDTDNDEERKAIKQYVQAFGALCPNMPQASVAEMHSAIMLASFKLLAVRHKLYPKTWTRKRIGAEGAIVLREYLPSFFSRLGKTKNIRGIKLTFPSPEDLSIDLVQKYT